MRLTEIRASTISEQFKNKRILFINKTELNYTPCYLVCC